MEHEPNPSLADWAAGFYTAKRAEGLATSTLQTIYKPRLSAFVQYCHANSVSTIEAITANLIRAYILHLVETGHNPGGVHQHWRVIKTFLLWYEREAAPDTWKNPVRKVKAPSLPEKILPPVTEDDMSALLKACDDSRESRRDKSILLTLYDTGLRAGELCALNLEDFNTVSGELNIRKGKGGKSRVVFLGANGRRAMRLWLQDRPSGTGALFCTVDGARLKYGSVRLMVARRAKAAGLPPPPLHAFRRGCALALHRAGVDLLSIQRILGHSSMAVLYRYIKQDAQDLQATSQRASPGDKL